MTQFSERYPPRNRKPEALPPLRIQVEDACAEWTFDPNKILACVYDGEARKMRPIARSDGKSVESELSPGHAAVWYRVDDVELRLRPDELERLVMCRLTPDEFKKLRDRHGIFFEIHSDFYDEETGEALQPKGEL